MRIRLFLCGVEIAFLEVETARRGMEVVPMSVETFSEELRQAFVEGVNARNSNLERNPPEEYDTDLQLAWVAGWDQEDEAYRAGQTLEGG